jgi:hypothetical protein
VGFGTGARVAQESLRSACMRMDARVAVRDRLLENRPNHVSSERDEGAAQTELHIPIAARPRFMASRPGCSWACWPMWSWLGAQEGAGAVSGSMGPRKRECIVS